MKRIVGDDKDGLVCVSMPVLVGIGILDCKANEGQPPEMTSKQKQEPLLAPFFLCNAPSSDEPLTQWLPILPSQIHSPP